MKFVVAAVALFLSLSPALAQSANPASAAAAQPAGAEVTLDAQDVAQIWTALTTGQVTVREVNGDIATFTATKPLMAILARAVQRTKLAQAKQPAAKPEPEK